MLHLKVNKFGLALSSLATALMLSFGVIAHEEPMESDWCSGGQIAVLGHFSLNHKLLAKFKGETNAVCSQFKSCGQFDDDDYNVSWRTAHSFCAAFSEAEINRSAVDDDGTVRPIFYLPLSFKNSEVNHHLLYSIDQGIEFSCAACSFTDEVRGETEGRVEVK